MKNKLLRTGTCLAAITALQVNAATVNGSSTASLDIPATSTINLSDVAFGLVSATLTGSQSLWTNSLSWQWQSDDIHGYHVRLTTPEDGTGYWNLTDGTNNIQFSLYTTKNASGTATDFTSAPTPGTNSNDLTTQAAGATQIRTATDIYDTGSGTSVTAQQTYQVYGGIDGSQLSTLNQGEYQFALNVDLIEYT